jgi:hypothetical protein
MNIWEAYQHLKAGKVIKMGEENSSTVIYVFKTVEEPLGIVRFKSVKEVDFEEGSSRPEALKDLQYEDLDEVCINSFESDDFECLTKEDLLALAQRAWDEVNDA